MELKAISDVIVRRLEGRCRFRTGPAGPQPDRWQGPDGGVYCLPPSVTSREGSSTGFEDTLYPWLRACRETSAGDPASPDYGVWQPGARCCRLTLIDDGPRVDEAARALARMPHEESRTAARDIGDWLASRQAWGGGDRIQDRMDHDAGSAAPTRRSDFGEQLRFLKERWADDIEIDGGVESKNEPTREQPVALQRSDEFGETRVLAALLTPQTGHSYEQVLAALRDTEGESRRQLFLEVGEIRRCHADELSGALEMLSYEFRMLVSREQLALIRRTTHATVIEEALRPDDMPGRAGTWPTGPLQANGQFSGADYWKRAQEALRKRYDTVAGQFGVHDAEYLLPGGTRTRITMNANGLDVVRLIERLYQAGTCEYTSLGHGLWDCIDSQAYDGGLLALVLTDEKSPDSGA